MSSSKTEIMWAEAIAKYEQITNTKMKDLPRPHSAEDLILKVKTANDQYTSFRERSGLLFKILSALAKPIEIIGNMASGATSAAFPPSSMIFGAAMYLINAAKGVSAVLDAISDLMTGLRNFSARLKVYERADISNELREKLTEILVTMIEVLARSTKKVNDPSFRLKEYAKNVLSEGDTKMQSLRTKLDELTRSESLLVGAETFVEVKSTGKSVQALQASLVTMQVTADHSAQGIADIKAALDESRTQLTAERNLTQFEAMKKMLNPSTTAQERFEQIKRERRLVPRSGDWILTEEFFNSWTACKERPLLWIAGNPGSGKSFLTYNIVTCIHNHSNEELTSASHEASVGFFFFQDNSAVTQSFRQALCDVAYQLTQSDPAYFKHLSTAGLSATDLNSVSMAWKLLFEDYWLSAKPSNFAYMVLDGLDEASSQERETFIDLLQGVEDLGAASRLRVAMLGRPHIVQEMTLLGLREPPTIYVDSTKNGADITLYVRSSIAKSQALKRVSKKLQAKIIETLTSKAGGMFMWAKLMISELNRKAQRSRESEVEKVLNEAPKDLTEMIRHVLEGFTTSLPPDEIEDLNTMLRWAALARRPLYLGELDAALRLKSEDGTGLVYLEGMLRKTYASLFTLSREDGMTTSELFTQRSDAIFDEDNDPESQNAVGDGEEDLDYPVELNSNTQTTTVSFSHTSISDYFLNPKHSIATDPSGEASVVGIDLEMSHFAISEACINMMLDEAYRDRMEGAVSLLTYAHYNWFEHLELVKRDALDEEARLSIGTKLSLMMYDEESIGRWVGCRGALFFTSQAADCLISWLKDPVVLTRSSGGVAEWLSTVCKGDPVEVFYHPMRYIAKQWVGITNSTWNAKNCSQIIHYWLLRRKGEAIDGTPALTKDDLLAAAQFSGCEENAEFYRRLAMSLRDYGHYEEAKQQFEKALELYPNWWFARAGMAQSYFLQEEYQQALDTDEATMSALEMWPKEDLQKIRLSVNAIYKRMGDSYSQLVWQIDKRPEESLEFDIKACEYHLKAFKANPKDYDSIKSCVEYWQMWARCGVWFFTNSRYPDKRNVPAPDRCFKTIMSLVHELHDGHEDESTHWLWNTATDDDEAFKTAIARAAQETGELQWLQERYAEAIARARKALKPVTGAAMVLNLATIYDVYANDGEKALKLWESLVSERALTTREETDMKRTRTEALRALGTFCLCSALKDEAQSGRYIAKLEEIWKRSRRSAAVVFEDMIPPADFAISLGAWYAKQGRREDAMAVVKTHVREAFALLSDDDPTNDAEGYLNLGMALLAVRDDRNTIALMHSLRQYRDGVAVLSSDADASSNDGKRDADNNDNGDQDSEDTEDESSPSPSCEGPCIRDLPSFDNTFTCRFCMVTQCADCQAQLLKDGSVPESRCSSLHEFLETAPLTTHFKKGEIVVDGAVVDFATWLQSIKKQWDL